MEALLSLLTGLRSGSASVQDVNVRMPNATTMVQRHEELFRMMNTARQKGAEAVDKFFESKKC
jgi:hypothetical protein